MNLVIDANRADNAGMRADVLQVVALACHGQATLARESNSPPELLGNSTFATTYEVTFERPASGRLAPGVIADAPGPWFRRLAKEGVSKLWVSLVECPFDPLADSEPWGVLSDGDVGLEMWRPFWTKRLGSHRDGPAWRVTYTATRFNRWSLSSPFALEEVQSALASAIRHCAPAHPLLTKLAAGRDEPFDDLYPTAWPQAHRNLGTLAARVARLLRSPSWADVLESGQMSPALYLDVSQELWRPTLMALESSVRIEPAEEERPTDQSLPLAG